MLSMTGENSKKGASKKGESTARILSCGARYMPMLLDNPEESFAILRSELDWVVTDLLPREEYYVNDLDRPYTYGIAKFARTYQPQKTHPEIVRIRRILEALTGENHDVCFLNLYRNQRHHLGWHADDSEELDPNSSIVSVSLGSVRTIQTRKMGNKSNAVGVESCALASGSAFIMPPGMQETDEHRIIKADHDVGERISLTFRTNRR